MHRDNLEPEQQKAFDAMLLAEKLVMKFHTKGKPVPKKLIDHYHRLCGQAKMSNGGFTPEEVAELLS